MRQNQTQDQKVMNHLNQRGSITSSTAIGTYGISRLAAVINRIRAKGVTVETRYFKGVNAPRVAEYKLMK